MLTFNDNKAGMANLDKEKISKIIEANTNEKYGAFSKKQQDRLNAKCANMKRTLQAASDLERATAELDMDMAIGHLEARRDLSRHCVHIDMDAFYAAVEMRDCPRLRSIPMAVGGMSMLSTSNYMARRFGVRAAMPGFIGKKLCPQLEIVPGDFTKYRRESEIFSAIFLEYDPDMSMGSLDEAYLDITDYMRTREQPVRHSRTRYTGSCVCRLPLLTEEEWKEIREQHSGVEEGGEGEQPAPSSLRVFSSTCDKCKKKRIAVEDQVEFGITRAEVVAEIRFRVHQATGLTCSAGIGPNWLIAKICSDVNKPNGQCEQANDGEECKQFIGELSVRKVPGIGRVSEAELASIGIEKVRDLLTHRASLRLCFSEGAACHFMRVALALPPPPRKGDRGRKSMSVEYSFTPSADEAVLDEQLDALCTDLCRRFSSAEELVSAGTLTLKIKLDTFDVLTRAMQLPDRQVSHASLLSLSRSLLAARDGKAVRLLGVRLSAFEYTWDKQQGAMDKWMEKGGKRRKEETEQPCSSTAITPPPDNAVSCPICGEQVDGSDRALNSHVDECLNRDALKQLSPTAPPTQSPPPAKKKANPKIADYFKR